MDNSDEQVELNGRLYRRVRGQWVDRSTGLVAPLSAISRLDRLLYRVADPHRITPASSLFFFWTWKNYVTDMEQLGRSYQLNHDSRLVPSLRKRDHIWAFTRRNEKVYVLAMDLVVEFIRKNRPGDQGANYGKHCAVGNPQACRYFDVDTAPDAEPLIRKLGFFRDDAKVDTTGQMLQGINAVRPLTGEEHVELVGFSLQHKELDCQ